MQQAKSGRPGSRPTPSHPEDEQNGSQETIDHLRRDIATVDEPQFKAMFETAAEVLAGLATAFEYYDQKSEPAWREQHGGGAH